MSLREMHDDYVSRGAVVALLLWGVATTLVVLVWVLALSGVRPQITSATGVLAVSGLMAASVFQIRLYTVRLCALLRVGAGLQSPDAELYSVGVKSPR